MVPFTGGRVECDRMEGDVTGRQEGAPRSCSPAVHQGSCAAAGGRPEPALLTTPWSPCHWVPGRQFLIFMSHNFSALSPTIGPFTCSEYLGLRASEGSRQQPLRCSAPARNLSWVPEVGAHVTGATCTFSFSYRERNHPLSFSKKWQDSL